MFTTISRALVAVALLTFSAFAQPVPAYQGTTEVTCGEFYVCLAGGELKAFEAATIKYKHPGGTPFGTVALTFKPDGTVTGGNAKGAVSGTWSIQDNKMVLKTAAWGEFNLVLLRIGDHLFTLLDRNGAAVLAPVQVAANN